MVKHIGIDSIPIEHISPESRFKSLHEFNSFQGQKKIEDLKGFFSCIGVAVVVSDYEVFKVKYAETIKKILEDGGYNGVSSESVFCSRDFNEFSSGEVFLHEDFLKKIKKSIEKITVIFSSLNCKEIPEVKIMSRSVFPTAVHPKILTLNHLNNTFPHICLWKVWKHEQNAKFFLDNFTGYRTNAWKTIETEINNGKIDLNVFFKGDQCNPLISTADIITRLIKNRLDEHLDKYSYQNVAENLPEFEFNKNLFVHEINPGLYPHITPREKKLIGLKKFIKHPIFYLLSPSDKQVDVDFFLGLPKGKKLLQKVNRAAGCVKTFSKNEDRIFLKNGDVLVPIDEEGEKTAELIKSKSGLNLDILPFDNE